jgi:HK97 gp10 family phage protein
MSKDIVSCKVDLGGISEKLLDLEPRIVRKLLRKSLKQVGKFWVGEAQSRTPVLLGDLKNSMTSVVKTRKGAKNSDGLPTGSVRVGPGFIDRTDGRENSVSPGVYGMFVEFGLKAKHYPKQPFMRPTFDATSDEAVELFADTMKSGLEDAIKD